MTHLLKNTPVRELIRALEKDGFEYRRRKGSHSLSRATLTANIQISIIKSDPYDPTFYRYLKAPVKKRNMILLVR